MGVNTLKSIDEKAITNACELIFLINISNQCMFVTENSDTFPSKPNSSYPPMADFEITTQGVYNILQNLNSYKSPGPDNVHPYALTATSMEISPMLTHLFQQSLNSGILPTQWKHAYITPIHKKGDRTNPKNYRPISLTSVVCKTMEHVVVSQLTKYLEMNKILTKNQLGFREHHSCELQLFVTVDDIARAINNKLQVDVAVLDFSKAFDKVTHSRLVHKLEYYGVRGKLLIWLESFLNNRTPQIVVEGESSTPCEVLSGVPPGFRSGASVILDLQKRYLPKHT